MTERQLTQSGRFLFEQKGARKTAGGPVFEISGLNNNALKVRRVMQLTTDLTGRHLSDLKVLDLACGEGSYSVEAGLHGATAVGIDGRMERMADGIAAARDMGLDQVHFEQGDVREISAATHGRFDAVWVLGILYHLTAEAAVRLLANVAEMTDTLIVDTHISQRGDITVEVDGWTYSGHYFVEHRAGATEAERLSRLKSSLDNELSFWFTRKSLADALLRAGFTSVMECHAPIEPKKPGDRVTFVARRTSPVRSVGYPWLNKMSQADIEQAFRPAPAPTPRRKPLARRILGRFRHALRR